MWILMDPNGTNTADTESKQGKHAQQLRDPNECVQKNLRDTIQT